MRTGRLPQSLADFDQAVALNPGIQRIWYNRGLVLAEMNQNDSALVSFEHSLRIEPKNVDALNNRGAMKLSVVENRARLAARTSSPPSYTPTNYPAGCCDAARPATRLPQSQRSLYSEHAGGVTFQRL